MSIDVIYFTSIDIYFTSIDIYFTSIDNYFKLKNIYFTDIDLFQIEEKKHLAPFSHISIIAIHI